MPDAENRRTFTRVSVHVGVRLLDADGGVVLEGLLNDVALGGLSVDATSDDLVVGDSVSVAIALHTEAEWDILASGKVVRADETGTAVTIEAITNPESYEHLRNLVLYNAPEPDRVEDEIHRHSGISRQERDA